jgi:uncharacterized protein YndB with AHSA1/START domain
MKKIKFSTTINAPREKVWKILWDLETYRQWTSVFAPGSTVKTDNWREGSRIEFGDGKGNGMISSILANRPNAYMSFKHLGVIKDGVVDTSSDYVKSWAGAEENYTLTETDGKTFLLVEMDTSGADFEEFLLKAWPTALEKIKELSENNQKKSVTVSTTVSAPVEKVWKYWNEPEHIKQWAFATPEWHAPKAENDLREGGTFTTRMEARDGSMGFEFGGTYTKVDPHQAIEYVLGDGREVSVYFEKTGDAQTRIVETFDIENTHPEEMQRGGWQAILDNFKKHVENGN